MTELLERLEKVASVHNEEELDLMGRLEKKAEEVYTEEDLLNDRQAQREQAMKTALLTGALSGGVLGAMAPEYNPKNWNPLIAGGVGAVTGAAGNAIPQALLNRAHAKRDEPFIEKVKEQGDGEVSADAYRAQKEIERGKLPAYGAVTSGIGGALTGAGAGRLLGNTAVGTGIGALLGAGAGYGLGKGLQYVDRDNDENLIAEATKRQSTEQTNDEESAEETPKRQGAKGVSHAPAGEDKTASELLGKLEKVAEEAFFLKKDKGEEKKAEKECDEECKEEMKEDKKEKKEEKKEVEKEANELMERLEKVAALKLPSVQGIKNTATNFADDLTGKTTRAAKGKAQKQLAVAGAGAAGAVGVGAGIKALSGKDSEEKNDGQQKQASENEELMNALYKEAAVEILNQPMEKVAKYNDPMNRIHFNY